ncbi:MAG: POTRA domain-containing protein, partial [Pedobacter sp.]
MHSYNFAKPRCGAIHAAFACLLLLLFLALPLHAAELVEIVISGIEGDALKNVQSTLVLPTGLVGDGTVDRLWLERFAKQADDKVRTALEPFGYYNALVTVTLETVGEAYRLLVKVLPGEPVRLSEVKVTVVGPGREERRLARLAATFPLNKGDVLLQPGYEEAKAALKSSAQDLGYLDAEFLRHEIRIEKSASTATVELALDTGEKYYFGETNIKGAPDYPDSFLRRHLTYKSGEVFS